jgi:protochlorophyllide reductase
MALFAAVARDLLRVTESVQTAGRLLAALTTEADYGTPGFSYWSNRLVRPGLHRFEAKATSPDAADFDQASALWRLSELLIGRCLDCVSRR